VARVTALDAISPQLLDRRRAPRTAQINITSGTSLACDRQHQRLAKVETVMNVIKRSFVFAAMSFGMFVSAAHAQGTIIVTVPFPFVVEHKEFPAGRYQIGRANQDGAVITIEDVNNGPNAFTFALTTSAGGFDPAGSQPALVFRRYETEYRLSQIWESTTEGREIPERSGARRIATADEQPGPSEAPIYVLADRK
jgi:hypothetical protein